MTEELVGLWVQSMVREIFYPRLLTCGGIIFLFLNYIYPAGRQAHQDVHMYNIIHTQLASKAVGRIATGGSFLTSSGWNQNMPSAGLPHGMCVRAQCYGGTKLAHCESITAKFVMQFFCVFYLSALPGQTFLSRNAIQ